MPRTVHEEAALAALTDMMDSSLTAESFKAKLSEHFPSWRGSAPQVAGYSDPDHHASIPAARALHDSLPVPFNTLPFKWMEQHGFGAVISYVDQHGRTDEEIDDLVELSVERMAEMLDA